MAEKTIGILTGGGDCPGLNAVIRAAVRKGITAYRYRFRGVLKGWKGMLECDWEPLGLEEISGILPKGGTILGTSRTNPFKEEDGGEIVIDNMRRMKLDALVAIGGEDTLGVADKLTSMGVPVIGVPKTIDNDLSGTDYTFGFDTAVNIVTEAIDRIHTTAESHNRVMVIEVMGRHSGWIALYAGLAGGADMILIPEQKYTIEEIVNTIRKRHERGKDFSIVVVAEGAQLDFSGRQGETNTWSPKGDSTNSATSSWAASANSSPTRSRRQRVTRRGLRCSGTCSAGGRPRPSTASWARALALPPSTWYTPAISARW